MTTAELLAKVRKIEIKARGLSSYTLAGEYHSKFKGQGMSFSEVREYTPGDDVRNIDWNVTARMQTPYIKVFEEEREMTIMLLIDISNSGLFGTRKNSKRDLIAEICATVAFSANNNNDKVGAVFFGNKIEKYIPPKKGKRYLLHLIRDLVTLEPSEPGTNIAAALKFLSERHRRKTVVLMLSDLISSTRYEKELQQCAFKHDLTAVKIYDPFERQLPDLGLMKIMDSESGEMRYIDSSDPKPAFDIRKNFDQGLKATDNLFQKAGASFLSLSTDQNYVKLLQTFFRNR